MALSNAERQRRSRRHRAGDHSLCDPARCQAASSPVDEPGSPAASASQVTTTAPARPSSSTSNPAPARLGERGRRLWHDMGGDRMPAGRREVLEEACRIVDRLERLDEYLAGHREAWLELAGEDRRLVVIVDKALSEARLQQGQLKQLIAELRAFSAGGESDPRTAPLRPTPASDDEETGGSVGVVSDITARLAARRIPIAAR